MLTFNLPYGRGEKKISLPKERVVAKLESKAHDFKPEGTESEIVRKALAKPIGSKTLSELVEGKENVVVISSDHTRPVPSHVTMPIILEEIRKGNPQAKISILVATGMHRQLLKKNLLISMEKRLQIMKNSLYMIVKMTLN